MVRLSRKRTLITRFRPSTRPTDRPSTPPLRSSRSTATTIVFVKTPLRCRRRGARILNRGRRFAAGALHGARIVQAWCASETSRRLQRRGRIPSGSSPPNVAGPAASTSTQRQALVLHLRHAGQRQGLTPTRSGRTGRAGPGRGSSSRSCRPSRRRNSLKRMSDSVGVPEVTWSTEATKPIEARSAARSVRTGGPANRPATAGDPRTVVMTGLRTNRPLGRDRPRFDRAREDRPRFRPPGGDDRPAIRSSPRRIGPRDMSAPREDGSRVRPARWRGDRPHVRTGRRSERPSFEPALVRTPPATTRPGRSTARPTISPRPFERPTHRSARRTNRPRHSSALQQDRPPVRGAGTRDDRPSSDRPAQTIVRQVDRPGYRSKSPMDPSRAGPWRGPRDRNDWSPRPTDARGPGPRTRNGLDFRKPKRGRQ